MPYAEAFTKWDPWDGEQLPDTGSLGSPSEPGSGTTANSTVLRYTDPVTETRRTLLLPSEFVFPRSWTHRSSQGPQKSLGKPSRAS